MKVEPCTRASLAGSLVRHLGVELLVAGAGALVVQATSHNPLLALGLGLAALALAVAIDALAARARRDGWRLAFQRAAAAAAAAS